MTPSGPYTNKWCDKPHWLVNTIKNNQIVYAIVPDGEQTSQATLLFPTIREAKTYLKDNGFTLNFKEKYNV